MAQRAKKVLFDDDSGEVLSEKSKRVTLFDENAGYLFWRNKQAVRIFPDILYPPGVTEADEAHLLKLAHQIYSTTNMLCYRGNKNVMKPLQPKQMSYVLGICERNTHLFLKRMCEFGIMARVVVDVEEKKETQYYMNPIYFFSGTRLSLNLYLIFRRQLDRYIPAWVREMFSDQEKALKNGRPQSRKGRKQNVGGIDGQGLKAE